MTRGVYILIIENRKRHHLQIGKLGTYSFLEGYYIYIGSALGLTSTSLEHRMKRHLSPLKKLFWHIDFLLNSEFTQIISIISAHTSERKECELASATTELNGANILIPHFGASDCKANCGAHLIYFSFEQKELINLIEAAFRNIGLTPLYRSEYVSR